MSCVNVLICAREIVIGWKLSNCLKEVDKEDKKNFFFYILIWLIKIKIDFQKKKNTPRHEKHPIKMTLIEQKKVFALWVTFWFYGALCFCSSLSAKSDIWNYFPSK